MAEPKLFVGGVIAFLVGLFLGSLPIMGVALVIVIAGFWERQAQRRDYEARQANAMKDPWDPK